MQSHRTPAAIVRLILALVVGVIVVVATTGQAAAHDPTVGLMLNDPASFDGYTLLAPQRYGTTYLIDNEGQSVHTWETGIGTAAYLLDDGSVLRASSAGPNPTFGAGGGTGAVRRFSWEGDLDWEYVYSTPEYMAHHDVELLPNGNVLVLAWEQKSAAEAVAAGRDPSLLADGELWPEHVIEVQPTGPTTGDIVWEWHVWDHLVQDFDAGETNFGVVADQPELIDINYFDDILPAGGEDDWLHANALDYNPDFDQIMISVRHFSELWVIDHSTTIAEAASHSGGDRGMGGDLLYRWGNPEAYDAGDASDQTLFVQHNTHWIEDGLPGAGNILVFNNGTGRPGGDYSTIDELTPPVDSLGNYSITPGEPYGPSGLAWTYSAPVPADFSAAFISGASRLPNGNTLICDGPQGRFFEVTPAGDTVWVYVNPVTNLGPLAQGDPIPSLGNIVFRAYRYAPESPALAGRDLTPGGPVEIVDADGDGLIDDDELKLYGTDPTLKDTDGDSLSDGAEVNGLPMHKAAGFWYTDPLQPDTDGDGCSDSQEMGADQTLGGLRDPTNPWDLFDATGDARVRIDDVVRVVDQFFVDVGDPGYTQSTDRTMVGPHEWNLGPPDGEQRVDDILLSVYQFFHDCV